MFDAVIFDMDGVLVDTEPLHFATTNAVLGRRGHALDQAFYDGCVGMAETAFFAKVVAELGLDDAPEVLARERTAASLERLAVDPLPPRDGALECLLALAMDGRALGLASSATGPQVRLVVERLGLNRLLGAVVSVDDVSRGKPAPDLFLEAARRLEVDPARALVVEDAVLGVTAALAAGMACVALVPGGGGQAHREAGALEVLVSLSELTPERLEGWREP